MKLFLWMFSHLFSHSTAWRIKQPTFRQNRIINWQHPPLFYQGKWEEHLLCKVPRKAVVLYYSGIFYYSRTLFIKSFTIVPKGLLETVNIASEMRAHFHLDAKVVADGHPFSFSVNTTHAHSRKFIIQTLLKNVFNKDASLSGKNLITFLIVPEGFFSSIHFLIFYS